MMYYDIYDISMMYTIKKWLFNKTKIINIVLFYIQS